MKVMKRTSKLYKEIIKKSIIFKMILERKEIVIFNKKGKHSFEELAKNRWLPGRWIKCFYLIHK